LRRIVFLITLCAARAGADPFDTFGFGARAAAMAGAATAVARGAAGAHGNPAAIVLGDFAEVTLGWGYGRMALSLNGRPADTLDVHGLDLGVALPFHLFDVPWAFGVALYLPDQFVARLQLIPATEPHFVLLDNDVHRLVAEPAISVRPLPWLALGVGLSLFTDVAGNGIQFDVGVSQNGPMGQGALDVNLPSRIAPYAGVMVMPTDYLRFGATYRSPLDLSLRLGIVANVDVADVVTGDAIIDIRAINFYTPRRLTFGAAVDVLPDLTVTAELAWVNWRGFHGGAPDVRILVDLGITPPLMQTLFPADAFQNTFLPRFGVEWRAGLTDLDLVLRSGYAFEPSPVPSQSGLTSFADNDRHIFALGGGIKFHAFEPVLTRPVALDVAIQWHHLVERLTVKDQAVFPGGAFSSGGNILRGSVTLSVSL
jgi:long-chain fatty acid transport protein